MLLLISLFAFLIFFWVIYIILKRFTSGTQFTDKVKVLNRYYIDRNLQLLILKILEKYYLILIGNNGAPSVLGTFDIDEISELITNQKDFTSILSKFIKREKND